MPQIHALIPAGDTLRTYRLAVATTGEYYIGRDMGLSIAGAERREAISLVVDDLKRRFRGSVVPS